MNKLDLERSKDLCTNQTAEHQPREDITWRGRREMWGCLLLLLNEEAQKVQMPVFILDIFLTLVLKNGDKLHFFIVSLVCNLSFLDIQEETMGNLVQIHIPVSGIFS